MIRRMLLAAGLALAAAAPALAQAPAPTGTLRIALKDDPDIMDPTLARTYTGRIVFAALCDKLFDINEKLEIVPQLATSYTWESPTSLLIKLRDGVTFHDGEKFDAASVVYSLNRHLTLQGSFRRGEISAMDSAVAVDPLTVRITLKAPSAAFLSQLTDRAGMIVSPKAAEAAGRDFGLHPVCTGPFSFVERVAQDRIVLQRYPGYWDAGRIHFARVIYRPIPDNNARLANVQTGTVEFAERMEPDDIATARANPRLAVAQVPELGYQNITININHGPRADTPMGHDARVRAAFELAMDRATINEVVYQGAYTPTAQAVPPASPYHVASIVPPARNVERARALLREAGVTTPLVVDMIVPNNPDLRQVAEVIQSMVAEAGFELKISTMEFASSLQVATRGEFETYLTGWSGRTDPDGNIWTFLHSRGPQNDGRYNNPEVDRLADAARQEADHDKRLALYAQLWQIAVVQDHARIYLWHRSNIVIHAARLSGYRPISDGMIRVQDLRLQ